MVTNPTGLFYHGTILVTNVGWGTSYDASMRKITIAVSWTNGSIPRLHSMNTVVSQYGLQKYIY